MLIQLPNNTLGFLLLRRAAPPNHLPAIRFDGVREPELLTFR